MFRRVKKIFAALTRSEKIFCGVLVLIAVVSGALLSRIYVVEATKEVPTYGGDYTEGFVGQPVYVNPVIASSEIDKSLVRLLFNNIEDVAEKIERDEEGRLFRVRIKEGLVWHDGTPLTSDDIIFTVEKIQDPDSRSPLTENWQGVLAERVSERELTFNLGVPYAFFDTHLKNLYILPKHLFQNIPIANWRISEFNLRPVGSGPYRFDAYDIRPDGFIASYRVKAADDENGMRPFISQIEFRFFPDKKELIEAINGGKIDGLANLEFHDLALIERPYDTYYFELPNYYAVFLNQNQNIALKEHAVREAFDKAIDKEGLIERIFEGHAKPLDGPLPPPFFVAADDSDEHVSSTIEIANALLEDAGWKLNETGLREKTVRNSSVPLEFKLLVPKIPFLIMTAESLKETWGKLGARITIEEADIEELLDPIIKNREYQMVLFGNILNTGFDLFPFWHSSERFHPGLNLSLYNNKDVDELIESIRQTPDQERIAEALLEAEALIRKDYPAIFLYTPDYLFISGKIINGIDERLIMEPAERFENVRDWHLKTKRVLK